MAFELDERLFTSSGMDDKCGKDILVHYLLRHTYNILHIIIDKRDIITKIPTDVIDIAKLQLDENKKDIPSSRTKRLEARNKKIVTKEPERKKQTRCNFLIQQGSRKGQICNRTLTKNGLCPNKSHRN